LGASVDGAMQSTADNISKNHWERNYDILLNTHWTYLQEEISKAVDNMTSELASTLEDDIDNMELSDSAKNALALGGSLEGLDDGEAAMVQAELDRHAGIMDKLENMDNKELFKYLSSDPSSMTPIIRNILEYEYEDSRNPLNWIMKLSKEDVKDKLDSFKDYLWNTEDSGSMNGISRVMNRFNAENFVTSLYGKIINNSGKAKGRLDKLKQSIVDKKSNKALTSALGIKGRSAKPSGVAKKAIRDSEDLTAKAEEMNAEFDALLGKEAVLASISLEDILLDYEDYYNSPKDHNDAMNNIVSFLKNADVMGGAGSESDGRLQPHHIKHIKSLAYTRDPNNLFGKAQIPYELEESFDSIAESYMSNIHNLDVDDMTLDLMQVCESLKANKKITKRV
jgi:hypothetical protein